MPDAARAAGAPAAASTRDDASAGKGSGALRTIAFFKGLEALVLILAGLGAFGLLNPEWTDIAKSWLDDLSLHEGRRFVARAAGYATRLLSDTSPERLMLIGAASFAYAGLRVVEGVGLWLRKRWAEYLTVIATASFLPFEVVAVLREHTPARALALALNVLVVLYLVFNLVRERRRATSASAARV